MSSWTRCWTWWSRPLRVGLRRPCRGQTCGRSTARSSTSGAQQQHRTQPNNARTKEGFTYKTIFLEAPRSPDTMAVSPMQVISFKALRSERRGEFCARMQARIVWLVGLLTQHGASAVSRKASAHFGEVKLAFYFKNACPNASKKWRAGAAVGCYMFSKFQSTARLTLNSPAGVMWVRHGRIASSMPLPGVSDLHKPADLEVSRSTLCSCLKLLREHASVPRKRVSY